MKNRKGFTLVELLGVIVLMGLISVAISVPILAQINKSSTKLNETALKLLYTDTELYLTKYSNTYKKSNGNVYYITVEQIINAGILEQKFVDAYSDSILSNNTQIKVTVSDNSYNYEIPSTQLDNIGSIYDDLTISSKYDYASGSYIKGDYSNNYVLYNGFIWRIMGKNSDGTIKLIMDELITSIIYGNDIDYSSSYVRTWLNDYFISHLQYSGILAKEKWYYNSSNSASNTTPDLTAFVEDKVGLLSTEEFNLSLSSSSSYLKGQKYGLLNQSGTDFYTTYSSTNVPISSLIKTAISVKPVINVYSSTIISDGEGTSTDPYILAEYKTIKNTMTLNNANLPLGSYISVDSKLYRVIEKSFENTKIISYFNPSNSAIYASSNNTFNLSNGAGYTLNTTMTKSDKFLRLNSFIGDIYSEGSYYKSTVFSKKNIVYDTYLSLPMIGEVLTTPLYPVSLQSNCYWTINMASSTKAYSICTTGASETDISTSNSLIYTSYISSNNSIASGSGTSSDPYIIN